jgi:hypothetical protein
MSSPNYSDWEDTFQINITAHYYLPEAPLPLLTVPGNLDLLDQSKGREEGPAVVIVDLISHGTSKRDGPFGCFVGQQVREVIGQGFWDQSGFYFFPFPRSGKSFGNRY